MLFATHESRAAHISTVTGHTEAVTFYIRTMTTLIYYFEPTTTSNERMVKLFLIKIIIVT